MRLEEKEQYNLKHDICKEELTIESNILLHNIKRNKNMLLKFSSK